MSITCVCGSLEQTSISPTAASCNLGKCGSHAHKGLFRTLQPYSKSRGAKNVTVSKFCGVKFLWAA